MVLNIFKLMEICFYFTAEIIVMEEEKKNPAIGIENVLSTGVIHFILIIPNHCEFP